MPSPDLIAHGHVPFCYVTTVGRRTGRAHQIEIWFAVRRTSLYLLAGDANSDWVRNMDADPRVTVRVGDLVYPARARRVSDEGEDSYARQNLAAKYQGWREGDELSDWARHALCIAIDVDENA